MFRLFPLVQDLGPELDREDAQHEEGDAGDLGEEPELDDPFGGGGDGGAGDEAHGDLVADLPDPPAAHPSLAPAPAEVPGDLGADPQAAPPPEAPPARAAHVVAALLGPRVAAEIVLHAPEFGGSLVFYATSAKFYAYCCNKEGHGRCSRNRTANGSGRAQAQGRPLGMLAAWLEGHNAPTKLDHSLAFHDQATRLAARQRWRQRSLIFAQLEARERALRPGESEEPASMP